ncbi:MFS transporter [Aurantibacillus circumpalustris]|uniref:MFS transporter n=1 Tax=Aurantibacillus circumpalustris TaxID=3036359 RepID=UPI00295B5325|nr:MFS transporter [Aurantibacillus circumpalustris]
MNKTLSGAPLNKIIIVAALGYFVDIYDLVLFSVERKDSLTEILGSAATNENLKNIGMNLLNWQMGGMLLGGLFWGILGDKKGRLSVLFGSILMYSLANIANGFVTTIGWYAALRFISGFGLAGELGAGITLVSETMSKEKRGIGTMIVATVGVFGAVVAGFMGDVITDWRWSFFIGGGMGLILLVLRVGIFESGMFESLRKSEISRGNFLNLFSNRNRAGQYLSIIMIAVPVWYVMGILITFAPEIFVSMGITHFKPDAGKSIMYAYLGITLGDVASGVISQLLKSRKKALAIFMILTAISVFSYFKYAIISEVYYYVIVSLIGFATGYWAVFMSTAAELFGTNIRATATTTAPNFVRGSVIFLSFLFRYFENILDKQDGKPNSQMAAIIVGIIVTILATLAWLNLKETFHKDLNYTE